MMAYRSLDPTEKPKAKFSIIFDDHEHALINAIESIDFFDVLNDPLITFGVCRLNIGDIDISRMPANDESFLTTIYLIERKKYEDLFATMTNKDRSDNVKELVESANACGIIPVILFEKMQKIVKYAKTNRDGRITVEKKILRRDLNPDSIFGYIMSRSIEMASIFSIDTRHTIRLLYNIIKYKLNRPIHDLVRKSRRPTTFQKTNNGKIMNAIRGGGANSTHLKATGYKRISMVDNKHHTRSSKLDHLIETHCISVGLIRTVRIYSSICNGRQDITHFAYEPFVEPHKLDPKIEALSSIYHTNSHADIYELAIHPLSAGVCIDHIIDFMQELIANSIPVWNIKYSHLWMHKDKIITLTSFHSDDLDIRTGTLITKTTPILYLSETDAEVITIAGLCLAHTLTVFNVDITRLELDCIIELIDLNYHLGFILLTEGTVGVYEILNRLVDDVTTKKEDIQLIIQDVMRILDRRHIIISNNNTQT